MARWSEREHPRDGEGQFTEKSTSWVGKVSDKIANQRGLGGMRPATERDLLRVKQLTGKKIPPAWTDVRVADDLDNARLLVQGKDAKGRLQSVYSAAHTQTQAAVKFKRVTELMKHLDKLDASIDRDAVDNDHAAALMLIRRLGMRPGSDRNTGADKAAHGATNLRARHVKVSGSKVSFDFTGKKGVHIQLEVDDPDIAAVVSSRLRRKSGDDRLFDTNETRTRDYMKTTGVPPEFLLKDLRTVRANVVALQQIAQTDPPANKAQFQRQRRRVAEAVSAQLGNTPTLALASYINPTVFSPWVQQEDWL